MREIKFRVFNTKTRQWTDSVAVYGDGSWAASFNDVDGYDTTDGCILMQFTGFHDKNGKDIYEGDIVRVDGRSLFPIVWGYFSDCCVNGETWMIGDSEKATLYDTADIVQLYNRVEIVGNIYENGNLLEREKQQ